MDTAAIQAAVDAAHDAGGGTARVPAGRYLTGTVRLRSGVTLQLDADATLVGSDRLEDYPLPEAGFVDAVGQRRGRSLLAADGACDLALAGEGTIDGRGALFVGERYSGRPFLVRFVGCADARVQGVTLRDAGAWVCHLDGCERVEVDGITIRSRANHNNDGIDVDGCRQVAIRGCDISTGDDAICLKATRARPCEDVTIEDCRLSSACGAIKIGTESYGDFRRIAVRRCHIYDTGLCAVKILSADGAEIDGVHLADIDVQDTTGPVFIRLSDRGRTYSPGSPRRGPGRIDNVTIERLTATVAVPRCPVENPWTGEPVPSAAFSGSAFVGLPGRPLRNIRLSDARIRFAGGVALADASRSPSQPADAYPEHFYYGVLPAWGIFARHVDGLAFERADLTPLAPDGRPGIACEDVSRLTFDGWCGATTPVIKLGQAEVRP